MPPGDPRTCLYSSLRCRVAASLRGALRKDRGASCVWLPSPGPVGGEVLAAEDVVAEGNRKDPTARKSRRRHFVIRNRAKLRSHFCEAHIRHWTS